MQPAHFSHPNREAHHPENAQRPRYFFAKRKEMTKETCPLFVFGKKKGKKEY